MIRGALLALLLAPSAHAALAVSASLSDATLALGEQAVLSVTITGSATAAPRIPPIPDVEIYESGRSSSMMIRNGAVQSTVVYAFVLAPRKQGKYRVPPIEVPGAAPTEPIDFAVGAAAAPPPPEPANPPPGHTPPPANPQQPGSYTAPVERKDAPDAFVTAQLDKKTARVNEQVTMTVRFHTAVPLLGRPNYESPKLVGVLAEDLAAEAQGTAAINGRMYNYSEIKTALFPVQAGRATVGEGVVTVQIPRRGAGQFGDDFFDRFFQMSAPETRRLSSEPMTLAVSALPEPKPDDFSGVVGKLSVTASADRDKVKAGEAVNLVVTVSGIGNIKSIPEPKRPDLPSVRFFDSESSVELQRGGAKVTGKKIFRTVIVPRVSGPLEIPPVTLSYFEPELGRYEKTRSAPVKLTVLPGDPNAANPVVGPGAALAPGVTAVAEDIRYLKTPGGKSALSGALAAFGAAGPLHALPVAFFVVALALDWRRRLHLANPGARRAREARSVADRRLKDAEAAADRAKAVALLAEALTGYLADKLGVPAAGLTLKAVDAKRKLAAAPRIKAVWEELDLLRFAPQAAGAAEVAKLAGEIRALFDALEKELS